MEVTYLWDPQTRDGEIFLLSTVVTKGDGKESPYSNFIPNESNIVKWGRYGIPENPTCNAYLLYSPISTQLLA